MSTTSYNHGTVPTLTSANRKRYIHHELQPWNCAYSNIDTLVSDQFPIRLLQTGRNMTGLPLTTALRSQCLALVLNLC
ncbi:hypothetical protein RRG08_021597 [Elysia crispata]|uniref:Uncharacterized protein n=1 Tax=Elysia crispata TaxID=231223 RepID=A0AAE1CEE5_9GAST|nr:hypothetical protein RRG08_021597 [Elysia crispata]